MTLYEKFLANWEAGYCTILQKGSYFCIISTKCGEGLRSSGWWGRSEDCKNEIGTDWIEESDVKKDWKIIGTIHCAELFGEGLKVGQKVRVGENGIIDRILKQLCCNGKYELLHVDGAFYAKELDPYYPETIEIDGKQYDKAQVATQRT